MWGKAMWGTAGGYVGSREGGAGGKMGFGSVGASRIRTLRGCQGRWVCLDGEERGRFVGGEGE